VKTPSYGLKKIKDKNMRLKQSVVCIMIVWAISGCSGRSAFDEIYSEVQVVKPTAKNYAATSDNSTSSILKEKHPNTTQTEEPKSVHTHTTGRIIDVTFDQDSKLYLYTILSSKNSERTLFFYDKKLNYTSNTLLDVDILDNYLITAKKHTVTTNVKSTKKKKIIKHKKRNYNIREAIEEKINTF
jgi:hypothetical protein